MKEIYYGIILSLQGFFFGFTIGIFNNFGQSLLKSKYPDLSTSEIKNILSNINFYIMLGGLISTLIGGILIKKLKKFICLISSIILRIIICVFFTIDILYLTYVFRLLSGFLNCFSTFVVPMMINETLNESKTKIFNGLYVVFLNCGICISFLINESSIPYQFWIFKIPLLIEIPSILLIIIFFRIKSPNDLIDEKIREEIIFRNYRILYEKEQAKSLTETIKNKNILLFENKNDEGFKDLFSKTYYKQFILAILLNAMNQLTGINFLMFYSTNIFTLAGVKNASLDTFLLGIFAILGSVCLTLISSKFSSRNLLIFGMTIQGISHFLIFTGLKVNISYLVEIGFFVYIFFFAMSSGGVFYSYLVKIIFPIGLSLACIIQWLLGVLISKFALDIINILEINIVIIILGVITIIGNILFSRLSINLENLTDDEIKLNFQKKTLFN